MYLVDFIDKEYNLFIVVVLNIIYRFIGAIFRIINSVSKRI